MLYTRCSYTVAARIGRFDVFGKNTERSGFGFGFVKKKKLVVVVVSGRLSITPRARHRPPQCERRVMAHSLTLVQARPRPTSAAAAAFRASTRGDSTSRYTPARGARARTRVAAAVLRPSASAAAAAFPPLPPPPCRPILLLSTSALPLRSRRWTPSPSPCRHYSRASSPVSTAASGSPPPPQEEPYDWAQFFPLLREALREDKSELLKLAVSLGAAGFVNSSQTGNFISDSQLHLVWWECCIISRLSRLVD
jgi:hypothetical protein